MRNFKDLNVWERAHQLTLAIYEVTRQSRRRCGRRGDGEMARFVTIAMGSASELEYHLLLARDLKLFSCEKHAAMHGELTEIRMMLSSLFVTVSKGARAKSADV